MENMRSSIRRNQQGSLHGKPKQTSSTSDYEKLGGRSVRHLNPGQASNRRTQSCRNNKIQLGGDYSTGKRMATAEERRKQEIEARHVWPSMIRK